MSDAGSARLLVPHSRADRPAPGDARGLGPSQSRLSTRLASLTVLLIPLPPVARVSAFGSELQVYAHQFIIVLLALQVALSAAAGRPSPGVTGSRWGQCMAGVAMLSLPLAVATDLGAGVAAYFNFTLGVAGGLLVGTVWAGLPRDRMNAIDAAIHVFLVVTAAQVIFQRLSAGSTSQFHAQSGTDWGASNYVAGVLAVGAILVVSRGREIAARRAASYLVGALSTAAALSIYSRGAVVALGAGLVVLLWNSGRTTAGRYAIRVVGISVPAAAWVMIQEATQVRLQVDSQVLRNVDARLALARLAWRSFGDSPVLGTGWASLRSASMSQLGFETTFAHSLALSFLQIGGLVALPFLVFLARTVLRALRLQHALAPAFVATLAISMTDPFFEGTVGGLIGLALAALIWADPGSGRESPAYG